MKECWLIKMARIYAVCYVTFLCPSWYSQTIPKPNTASNLGELLINPHGLALAPFKLSAEKCNFPELAGTEDADWCNQIVVEGYWIQLKDGLMAQKINSLICQEIIGTPGNFSTLKQFVNDFKTLKSETGEPEFVNKTSNIYSTYYNNNLLVLEILSDEYYLGAAHGLNGISVLNIDLQTGELYTLENLIKPGSEAQLTSLAREFFLEQNGRDMWDFETNEVEFHLSTVFRINGDGISFIYQPYELGPYAEGAPEVMIPYEELNRFLKVKNF